MERVEWYKVAAYLKSAYGDKFNLDKDGLTIWFENLSDLPGVDVMQAVRAVIMTSPFPPTIADIRKRAVEGKVSNLPVAEEAWSKVRKALQNSLYNSKEQFERLDDISKSIIGSPGALAVYASMNADEVETVIKSHFIRSYNEIRQKRVARAPLAVGVMDALGIEVKNKENP